MSFSQCQPLHEPPFRVYDRSWVERACLWVPFLGWIVAAHLEGKRLKPKWTFLCEQIVERRQSVEEAWGANPDRWRVAAILSEEIQKEFGWPNANFIPQDRLALLTWSSEFDRELLSVIVSAEERLGVAGIRPPAPLDQVTLGQWVDQVLTRLSASDAAPPGSAA